MIERVVRFRRLLRPVPAVVLGAIVATGCASGGSASPTPSGRQALPAGEYRSNAFRPVVTFTLPKGWFIGDDGADYLALQPASSDALGIYLFRSPGAASQAADCPTTAVPAVGPLAKDLVDWIEALPGLKTGPRTSVAVGGLAGLQLEIAIEAGWTESCPFADGLPTVPLLVGANGLRWVLAGSERLRLAVLDVPAGGTVVVDVDAFDGSLFDDFLPIADTIVKGMRFAAL